MSLRIVFSDACEVTGVKRGARSEAKSRGGRRRGSFQGLALGHWFPWSLVQNAWQRCPPKWQLAVHGVRELQFGFYYESLVQTEGKK